MFVSLAIFIFVLFTKLLVLFDWVSKSYDYQKVLRLPVASAVNNFSSGLLKLHLLVDYTKIKYIIFATKLNILGYNNKCEVHVPYRSYMGTSVFKTYNDQKWTKRIKKQERQTAEETGTTR